MSVYVLFRISSPEQIEAALARHLPGKYMKIADGEYIASATGTARSLSDALGISTGDIGSAMIFKMTDYFGRASTEIWDWVKSEAEANGG